MPRVLTAMLVLLGGTASAATFTVTNTSDDGDGSLRWAIGQANSNSGADTIEFAPALAGRTIFPFSPLPALMDARTTVDGDIDDDGAPDIGISAPSGSTLMSGLRVLPSADHCRIIGLAISNFRQPGAHGIEVYGVTDCRIRSCHLGVNLAGTAEMPNYENIELDRADGSRIGGADWDERNVISAGEYRGISLWFSDDNRIVGNFIGVTRDGTAMLRATPGATTHSLTGVRLIGSRGNRIGGGQAGQTNVIAGVRGGLLLYELSDGNIVTGNWFGLAADGRTPLELTDSGIEISDSGENRIGGTRRALRNVFAGGAEVGIRITTGAGFSSAEGNIIRGNYFGTNAAGTVQQGLRMGVVVGRPSDTPRAGRQFIGGDTSAAANWFCPYSPGETTCGVHFSASGTDSVVRHNRFGLLHPKVTETPRPMTWAVRINNESVAVRDNAIWRAKWGVWAWGERARQLRVFGNRFNTCGRGVEFGNDARGSLGNLGNPNANDDGGNVFMGIKSYCIVNATPFGLPAEGNDFGTKSAAAIEAMILDRMDSPKFGRVDYDPLIEGISPTAAGTGSLMFLGTAALPTRQGAELAFALSAPAKVEVTVRNVAGRVVAVVCRSRDCGAGRNSVLWEGRNTEGLAVPAGRYLVEFAANGQDGGRTTAIAPLQMSR